MSAGKALIERGRHASRASRLAVGATGLLLAAVLIIFGVSHVLAVDLLSGDGGFDTTTQWGNWSKVNLDGVTFSQDTASFQAGSASAVMTGTLAARQSGTLTGYLEHLVQVGAVTDSLQLALAYYKDVPGTPSSVRIYWELWSGGSTFVASGDLDTSAGTSSAWGAPRQIGLSGLNLRPGVSYSLRLGFAVAYGRNPEARTASVRFDSVILVQDREPPAVTLVDPSPAAGSYQNQADLTFHWQGNDNATPAEELEFQYSTDGGSLWSAWTLGQTQATVSYPEGAGRPFAVRARDRAGNVSAPDQRAFTVDLTPPAATIESGLENGATSPLAAQAFTWSGIDNLSAAGALRYEYSTDGGVTWIPAGTALEASVTYTEGVGRTFDVRAIDQAGNVGPATRRTFTIDLTAPSVSITGGPDGGAYVNQIGQTFSWQGSDQPDPSAPLSYQYSTDGGSTRGAWGPASSVTATFPEGPARFDVRAKDPAGNVGSAATAFFTVDLTAPPVQGAVCTPGISEATVTFTTHGDPARGVVRYGTVPGQPSATAVEAAVVENHAIRLTGLAPDTTYYYVIEVTDRAGNATVTAESSFGTLPDIEAPDSEITGGPAEGSWQSAATLTFNFVGTDNVTPAGSLRYQHSVDGGGTWSEPSAAVSASISGYADGPNRSFLVRAVDEAGNVDPTPAQRTFHVDRTAPGLTLAAGPNNGEFVTTTSPHFSWSGTDAQSLQYATSVDGGVTWSAWAGGNTAQPTYAEGRNRTFSVKVRDLAGNESGVLHRSFHVDVTAPTVAIVGGLEEGAVTNQSRQTFTWSGSDNVSGASLQYSHSLDGGVTWSIWTSATQGTFDLPDGRDMVFQVRSRDEAGHVSAAAGRGFTVDTVPPPVRGLVLKAESSHADLTWTTTGDPSTSVVRWGTQPGLCTNTTSDSRLLESHSLTLSGLLPGTTYYYVVESADAAGNVSLTSEATFTTTAVVPHVIATVPDAGDPSAGTGTQIKAYFDVDMDPATITGSSFYLVETETGTRVDAASITYEASARAAILVPAAGLTPNTAYQATVTTAAASVDGQHLQVDHAWTFATGSTAVSSPHGNFSTNNAACKSCHNTHSSPAVALLSKTDVTSLCFTCHDGTGSSMDVTGQFTGAGEGGSLHPVKGLPVVSLSLLNCSDCHNAHGDKKPDGTLYPRLLRVGLASGGYASEGNMVCLACHGPDDLQWSATYWADTAGDHSNGTAAHYQNFSALVPTSGTGITCVSCHESHASPALSLLQQSQPEGCLGCHENPANSQSARNIREEFSGAGTASRHDVFNVTGAALACPSCHGPHGVTQGSLAGGTPQTEVSNPQNTKQDMASATAGTTASRRYTDFCLSCHNANAPAQTSAPSAVVPVTIAYPDRVVTTNAGGGGTNAGQRTWNKAGYTGSAHYQAGLGCNTCHESHGSPYDLLQSRPEDTTASGASGICGLCHSGVPPAEYASAPNVWPDLSYTDDAHRHPALTIAWTHQDTEDLAGASRHAECVDCHDPHTATQAAPALNVSGVDPVWGAAWTAPQYTQKNPAGAAYQVCLKCHSSYAFGPTPPVTTGGIPATDVAREINPNNPSYHSDIGSSRISTFADSTGQTRYYGKFVNGWTAISPVTCGGCHGSASGVRGAHGSANAAILKAPFVPGSSGTGTNGTSGDICFQCHDYNFYTGSDGGSDSVRSAFSNSTRLNLHAIGQHRGRGCTTCHVAVPHGWSSRSLVADIQADPAKPAPYFVQSSVRVYNWATPGAWQEPDCGGCHDKNF